MKHPLFWCVLAVVVLLIWLIPPRGEGGAAATDPDRNQVAYVCTETGRVVRAAAQAVPATNPETGRNTLMPGLYCAKCKAWHPTAPFEILQRNPTARLCPKHRIPMETSDGT